jgi:hypothetical protein
VGEDLTVLFFLLVFSRKGRAGPVALGNPVDNTIMIAYNGLVRLARKVY